jgi:hypothetical protein
MITNPNIDSNNINVSSIIATDTTTTTQSPATHAPPVLPPVDQLMCSGDPGAMFAALAMKTAKQEQTVARKQRDEALSAQENAEQSEVADMRDKANLQRVQGVVDGCVQIAAGATQMAAGFEGLHATAEQNEATSERADLKANGTSYSADHQQALQPSAQALTQGAMSSQRAAIELNGTSAGFTASRSIADGFFNGAITDDDANAKMHDATATTFKQIADDAHDSQNDAKDLLHKALDFYKQYVETKNQTVMAAIRRT